MFPSKAARLLIHTQDQLSLSGQLQIANIVVMALMQQQCFGVLSYLPNSLAVEPEAACLQFWTPEHVCLCCAGHNGKAYI
jgi:hypothetical protein